MTIAEAVNSLRVVNQDGFEPHIRTTSVTEPPIEEWERQGALRELTRLAADLELDEGDAVIARLGRLTEAQRTAVAAALEQILELGD